jgi:predicted Zn finger-like uncharacterized protein
MTQTANIFHVECTSCQTSFPVDPAKVPEGGVLARCSECSGVFRVEVPESADALMAPSSGWEPEAPATESPPTPAHEPFSVDTLEMPSAAADTGIPVDEAPVEADPLDFSSIDLPAAEASEPAALDPEPPVMETETPAADFTPPVVETEPPAADFTSPVVETELPAAQPVPATPVFGRRDPKEKARRLARVLVSDMITYNADRHAQALAGGTIEGDFEDEIKKSWAEYVDQVGEELAESTPFFTDALNEILAPGQNLF